MLSFDLDKPLPPKLERLIQTFLEIFWYLEWCWGHSASHNPSPIMTPVASYMKLFTWESVLVAHYCFQHIVDMLLHCLTSSLDSLIGPLRVIASRNLHYFSSLHSACKAFPTLLYLFHGITQWACFLPSPSMEVSENIRMDFFSISSSGSRQKLQVKTVFLKLLQKNV